MMIPGSLAYNRYGLYALIQPTNRARGGQHPNRGCPVLFKAFSTGSVLMSCFCVFNTGSWSMKLNRMICWGLDEWPGCWSLRLVGLVASLDYLRDAMIRCHARPGSFPSARRFRAKPWELPGWDCCLSHGQKAWVNDSWLIMVNLNEFKRINFTIEFELWLIIYFISRVIYDHEWGLVCCRR